MPMSRPWVLVACIAPVGMERFACTAGGMEAFQYSGNSLAIARARLVHHSRDELLEEVKSRMMSNAECAKFLGIAPRTLRNWRGKKKGPAPHKFGGKIMYRERDVEIWLA